MRTLVFSFLILSLCQLAATTPSSWADDDGSNKPAEAQRTGKSKKVKRSRTDAAAPAAATSSSDADSANLNVDQTLDLYLGKSSPKSDSAPAFVPPPPPASAPASAPAPASASAAAPATSSAASASTSVDQTLDLYLGKNPPTTRSAAPADDDPLSAAPGGARSDASGDASNTAMPDEGEQPVIGDRTIPENTLKAGELNNQAVEALNSKDFQKAIDLLKQALVADPAYTQGKGNLAVAYFDYAVELYNDSKYAEAIPPLEKALAISKQLHRDDADLRQLYEDCKQAVKENSAK